MLQRRCNKRRRAYEALAPAQRPARPWSAEAEAVEEWRTSGGCAEFVADMCAFLQASESSISESDEDAPFLLHAPPLIPSH